MKNWLEKQFKLSAFQTDVKAELLAGLTTFVTMAYVQPFPIFGAEPVWTSI